MFTQPTTQLVQWQDFKVKSEVDIVFEIAQQKGWKDCEIFGHGDMITQPLESMGWKLIPADLYEYSIPAEGVDRVLQTINAGVRIKGVIIADDERSSVPPPAPARPEYLTAIGQNSCGIHRQSTAPIGYGDRRYCSYCTGWNNAG